MGQKGKTVRVSACVASYITFVTLLLMQFFPLSRCAFAVSLSCAMFIFTFITHCYSNWSLMQVSLVSRRTFHFARRTGGSWCCFSVIAVQVTVVSSPASFESPYHVANLPNRPFFTIERRGRNEWIEKGEKKTSQEKSLEVSIFFFFSFFRWKEKNRLTGKEQWDSERDTENEDEEREESLCWRGRGKMWLPFYWLSSWDATKRRSREWHPEKVNPFLFFFLFLSAGASINDAQLIVEKNQLALINRHNNSERKWEWKASEIASSQWSKGSHKSTSRASG